MLVTPQLISIVKDRKTSMTQNTDDLFTVADSNSFLSP